MTKPAGYFDGLFRYSVNREVTLPDGSTLKVVAHQLGAQNSSNRNRLAMAEAKSSYRKFNDPNDFASITLDEWLDLLPREEQLAMVESAVRGELIREAVKERYINTNNEPEDVVDREPPPTSLTEVVAEEVSDEDRQEDVRQSRIAYVEENLPVRMRRYADDAKLLVRAREVAVERAIQDIHDIVFGDATLLYGIYKEDGKTPLFSELPSDAPQELKDQLHAVYAEVDRPSYDPSSSRKPQ